MQWLPLLPLTFSPFCLPIIGDLAIYLTWDTTELGGADLDSVMQDADGCIVSGKDASNGGYCFTSNGYVELGGLYSYLQVGGMSYLNTPVDTSSTSGGNTQGIEALYLADLDVVSGRVVLEGKYQ